MRPIKIGGGLLHPIMQIPTYNVWIKPLCSDTFALLPFFWKIFYIYYLVYHCLSLCNMDCMNYIWIME